MKNKNNNKAITISIIIFGLILIGLGTYYYIENNRLQEINYDTFFKKWQNKDSFVLVISKTDCQYCEMYLPKIKTIVKDNKIKIYYVNVDKFKADESDSFSEYIDYNGSTPTTVFIENGEEKSKLNRITGNVKSEKIIEKLKKMGYIK